MSDLAANIEAAIQEALGRLKRPTVDQQFDPLDIDDREVASLLEQGVDIRAHAHQSAGVLSETADAFIKRKAADIAMIAALPPPTEAQRRAFTYVGARRARKELNALATGKIGVDDLHATTIAALADAGWMRDDLRGTEVTASGKSGGAFASVQEPHSSLPGRPANERARAIVRLAMNIFEQATGKPAHHNSTSFLDVLQRVADVTPGVGWPRNRRGELGLQKLVRTVREAREDQALKRTH